MVPTLVAAAGTVGLRDPREPIGRSANAPRHHARLDRIETRVVV